MNQSGNWKSFVKSRRDLLVCLGLAAVTLTVYWQVSTFEFTNYDDYFMLAHNPMVSAGLTPAGILWAFSTSWFDFWHPLAWLSHMMDFELFGANAGMHHLVNLGFHVANTLLLFIVLRRISGAWRRSAMVAALFALHPLHVESVAWLAERKDVLSGLFFMLSLWAYSRYAEEKTTGLQTADHGLQATDRSLRLQPLFSIFYLLSLTFFALGLMSKPMLVTVPFVLLILDYWPLRRYRLIPCWRLAIEKLPFFGLTLASCLITYYGFREAAHGSVREASGVPWSLSLANIPVSYVRYAQKILWPINCAVLYPYPDRWQYWQVGGSIVVLLLLSIVAWRLVRSAPYLATGWCIYLGMLVPVIGIIPTGVHSMADQFSYLPSIGIFLAIVWSVSDWTRSRLVRVTLVTPCALAAVLVCAALSWAQAGYWRNSVTLWKHCLSVTRANYVAHYNLGHALQAGGQIADAIQEYRAALRLKPDHADANLNLGIALIGIGQSQEATNNLGVALRVRPEYARAQGAMGLALYQLGDYAGAETHCGEAIRLDPDAFGPYVDMGQALSAQGRSDDALRYYAEGLRLNPGLAQTHYYLGLEWVKRGDYAQAVASFGEAVRLAPTWKEAREQWEKARGKVE